MPDAGPSPACPPTPSVVHRCQVTAHGTAHPEGRRLSPRPPGRTGWAPSSSQVCCPGHCASARPSYCGTQPQYMLQRQEGGTQSEGKGPEARQIAQQALLNSLLLTTTSASPGQVGSQRRCKKGMLGSPSGNSAQTGGSKRVAGSLTRQASLHSSEPTCLGYHESAWKGQDSRSRQNTNNP